MKSVQCQVRGSIHCLLLPGYSVRENAWNKPQKLTTILIDLGISNILKKIPCSRRLPASQVVGLSLSVSPSM